MAVLKNTTLSFQFLNTLKSLSDLNIFYSFFLNLTWFFKFILMMMTILFLKWLFLTDKRESYYQYSTAEEFVDKKIEDVGKIDSKKVDLNNCSFCGNLCTKTRSCSRCKTALYCSWACQATHWRFWHEYECIEIETEPQYELPVHVASQLLFKQLGNGSSYSSGEDDEQITDERKADHHVEANEEQIKNEPKFKLLSISSEKAIEKPHEMAEQLRTLKEELAKIKNENMSLKSERDNWETLAKNAKEKLISFMKESEHQMLIMKHKKDLISESEKKARGMVDNLSEKLRYLQNAEEKRVTEMKRQEEFIHMLKNEYAKAVKELQEEKEYVRKVRKERDQATQLAMKMTEETGQKLLTALDAVAAIESRIAPPSLSPSPVVSRINTMDRSPGIFLNEQACAICLNNDKDMAFGCGHMTCRECGLKMSKCPICRQKIKSRVRLFH